MPQISHSCNIYFFIIYCYFSVFICKKIKSKFFHIFSSFLFTWILMISINRIYSKLGNFNIFSILIKLRNIFLPSRIISPQQYHILFLYIYQLNRLFFLNSIKPCHRIILKIRYKQYSLTIKFFWNIFRLYLNRLNFNMPILIMSIN